MSLLALPLELKRDIASRLENAPDLYALLWSQRSLQEDLLGDDFFNKALLERIASRSLEHHIALSNTEPVRWRAILENVLERERNLAKGWPANITSFPIPDDFLYQGHTLILLYGSVIELYGIYANSARVFSDLFYGLPKDAEGAKAQLVHYSSGVLSIRLQAFEPSNSDRLVFFRITKDEHLHLLLLVNVPSEGSEVVRNNKNHAVVGTYALSGDSWSWKFAWFSLETLRGVRLFEIGNFASHEIGTDIVFEVFDDWFWVVTSQVTVDPEGSDPTNYYGGCRLNLAEPGSRAEYWRIWRRNQTEGTINDSFTRLALIRDEKNDENYIIIESRAEWQKLESAERSFYATVFKPERFDDGEVDLTRPLAYEELAVATDQDISDYIEILLAAGDDSCLTVFAGERYRHAEQGVDAQGSDTDAGNPIFRARQLAHSAFFPLSETWTDVVWDSTSNFDTQGCALKGDYVLRVRVGSRRVGPSYKFSTDNQNVLNTAEIARKVPTQSGLSYPIYWHQPTVLFPRKDASVDLLRCFEIPGYPNAEMFKISSDNRGIVIGLKNYPSEHNFACERNIFMVNFDPMARWAQLRSQVHGTENYQNGPAGLLQSHHVSRLVNTCEPSDGEPSEGSAAEQSKLGTDRSNVASLQSIAQFEESLRQRDDEMYAEDSDRAPSAGEDWHCDEEPFPDYDW